MAIRSALQSANKARGASKDHGDTPIAGPFRMENPNDFMVELGVYHHFRNTHYVPSGYLWLFSIAMEAMANEHR